MQAAVFLLLFGLLAFNLSAQDTRPVGTFGGFINKEGKVEIPQSNGFLTFAADTNVSAHALQWKRFDQGGKDHKLCEMRFPVAEKLGKLNFIDWSTLKVTSPQVSIYLSRTFPAVRYDSKTSDFALATGIDGRQAYAHLALVINGKITQIDLADSKSVDLRGMSEPWLLLWAGDRSGRQFDVPLLMTFEKRPERMRATSQGVSFSFDKSVGAVNLLALRGLRRFDIGETKAWQEKLPGNIIVESRAWVQKLAAFPVGLKEEFKLSEDETRVHISDKYSYQLIQDDWGTIPTPIAPLPPVVVRAQGLGYPVFYPQQTPIISPLATFYGNFSYQDGSVSTYSIPLPNALKRLPIALRVSGSPEVIPVRQELERILAQKMPAGPSSFYVHNDDIASALMCDAYATLEKNGDLQKKIRQLVPRLFAGSFAEDRTPVSIEPVTNQSYRSPGKHQYESTPFDREWYTGRKLAAMARCAEAVDLDLAKENWEKMLGLYRYSQIFFDWVTGSVTSSVFGFNQLADGIHFIWEGVLGVARLAKHLGDEKTYQDAAYRSARQQLALFAIWHQAKWSKDIDYAVAHFSVTRLPNDQIETRGAVDAWVEDFGAATLQFESMWQTANFIFFDNAAQYSFYRDFGIIQKVKTLEYEIMPELHPSWTDGNVMDPIDKKYYGSGDTIAHLLARAVLFHDNPGELFKIFKDYEGTEVSKQWYTPYFFGNSGPLLLGIERAQAPVVEAPIGGLQVVSAAYNANSKLVSIEYRCRTTKILTFKKRFPGEQWQELTIQCSTGVSSIVHF